MKEIIGRLSRGIYEYDIPTIISSVSIIELTIGTDSSYYGNFQLYSENEVEIKGIIYSTNDKFIIMNDQFVGNSNIINYRIQSDGMEMWERIQGSINIVSNGGEIVIPFDIRIEPDGITSLDDFANLVMEDYEEGMRFFFSPEFEKNLLTENPKYNSVYNGLVKGADKHVAMEEFLVFCGKKEKVSLSLSQYEKTYLNLEESYGDSFVIRKEHWGYVDIETEIKGDFIKVAKRNITSDMFAGNSLEYNYYINHSLLINGINTAKVIFKTLNQSIEYTISVDNRGIGRKTTEKPARHYVELYSLYIKMKLKHISTDMWAEYSFEAINRLKNIEKDSIIPDLIGANILLNTGDKLQASEIIENHASEIIQDREDKVELYCYFLYLRALEKNDPVSTHEVVLRIREYYENGYDNYRILLMMLLLEGDYENNKSLVYARLKDQFLKGCRSPLIYYEALKILNESPELLRIFNSFEIQVLNFGAKNHIINKNLASRLTEVALNEKSCKELLIRILNHLFDTFMDKSVLEAICTLLIRENKTDNKYFKWYEAGVRANIKITKLYEYYMHSISTDYMDELPQGVLLYFLYNANILNEKQSFLYYNIVMNKEKLKEIYRNYIKRIEKYATENMALGNVDEFLAYIYKKVLNKTLLSGEVLKKLPEIIHTYKIECENKNVRKVIVCHKELFEEKEVRLSGGEAYVKIFSGDASIILEDYNGRRYVGTVDYRLEKLFDDDGFVKLCLEYCSGNKYLIMSYTKSILKNTKDHTKVLNVLERAIEMDEYRPAFAKSIMQEVVEYYYENYDNEILDDYLVIFNKSKMNSITRTKITELMIIRGMYDHAYNMFVKYGFENVQPSKALKFCKRIFDLKGTDEDQVLTRICMYAFRNGKYNEDTLKYLSENFYGLTKEMLDIWKASINFVYESRELSERLVVQILFTKNYTDYLTKIYEEYRKMGASTEMKRAYLYFCSCEFYLKSKFNDESFLMHLEEEINDMNKIEDMCTIAYLKICSDLQELNKERTKHCINHLFDLSNRKIRLPFYKKFSKWFTIPYSLRDKYIVEYKANPKSKVYINYILENGSFKVREYENELMDNVCAGIYTKEFILFYGENVQYYIKERNGNEEFITESYEFSLGDEYEGDDSRYGMLNNMLLSSDLNDEKTLFELAENYLSAKEIVSRW